MENALEILLESKRTVCEERKGNMAFVGIGTYECVQCGHTMYDDYGKIRKYIDEFGPSSMAVLAQETGVNRDVIDYLIKDGVLYEPKSKEYTKICGRCGCSITTGRFCKDCMLELSKELSDVMKPV